MGTSKGFLARHFNAGAQGGLATFIRQKLGALGLALPVIFAGNAVATPAQAPDVPVAAPPVTAHAIRVDTLNRAYGRVGPHDQIIFIDRDDIANRMARMPRGVTRETALEKAVGDYILERSGYRLPEGYATAIAEGISGGGGLAVPVPGADTQQTGRGAMCVVVGHNPDVTGERYQNMIMGLYQGLHDDLLERTPRQSMPAEAVSKMTDYHEMGHCVDRKYLPRFLTEPNISYQVDLEVNTYHQAEAFAETFGALMLARDGYANVAGIRADQRLISIATNGYILSQMAGWDTPEKYIGYIYALHEVLWDTQRTIDDIGVDGLSRLSVEQIRELAYTITERNKMFTPGSEHAVTFLLENKFNLDVWETLRQEFPHLEPRYQIALRVRDDITQAFIRMYGPDIFDPARSVGDQLARELRPEMFESAPRDPDRIRADVDRIAEVLRRDIDGADDPELQIVLNAMREKERLRGLLNDPARDAQARAQAMVDLALMTDVMRMEILASRKARHTLVSHDNRTRLMAPVVAIAAPLPL